jgi:hypothetical protein
MGKNNDRSLEKATPIVWPMGLSILSEKIDKNGAHRYISKQAL